MSTYNFQYFINLLLYPICDLLWQNREQVVSNKRLIRLMKVDSEFPVTYVFPSEYTCVGDFFIISNHFIIATAAAVDQFSYPWIQTWNTFLIVAKVIFNTLKDTVFLNKRPSLKCPLTKYFYSKCQMQASRYTHITILRMFRNTKY